MIKKSIYLDNNASTPLSAEVLECMMPFFTEHYGNPSSTNHNYGLYLERVVAQNRSTLAEIFGLQPDGIVFTASATESINLVIKGVIEQFWPNKRKLIISKIEHPAAYKTAEYLESKGVQVVYLNVDQEGFIDLEELKKQLDSTTALVSIIAANNEIGTIQNIEQIAALCKEQNVLSHFDFAQLAGKVSVNVTALHADFITLSAHKHHGPVGVGALLSHKAALSSLTPLLHGGGQEYGLRSGTLNTAHIVGLVKCFAIYHSRMQDDYNTIRSHWDYLYSSLIDDSTGFVLNGPKTNRLFTNFNFYIPGVSFGTVQQKLPNFAFSGSSACATRTGIKSYVLHALGFSQHRINNSIRIGIGRQTTRQELELLVTELQNNFRK